MANPSPPAFVESTPEVRRRTIEINIASLRRHLVRGAKELSLGQGNLWSMRKKSNSMLKEIYGQMAALAAVSTVKRKYERK